MPGAGLEPACPKAAGFKPAVSHQFHHPGDASLRPASVKRMDERERVLLTLAGMRVFMGMFWLVNLLWRLPTDFGGGGYWGVAHILIGVPLRRHSPRARLLAILTGSIDLILLPFGTPLGIYALSVLLNERGKAVFGVRYS